jgi:hypothetical protein
MEEERVSRLHLDVHEWQALRDFRDPFGIGSRLIAGQHVVHSSAEVGALENLEAAVLPCGGVYRNEDAHEIRIQDAVSVPIAVVLVPGPGPSDPGLLHDHLRVVVIDPRP